MNIKVKILIVEDDLLTQKALEFRLKKDGYNVVKASDGLEAKELLIAENPDILITDLMIPFLSGLELIEFAKNKLGKSIPVIVLSAANQEKIILDSFNLGADDFMSKPFSPLELTVRVKRLLSKNG
ncbi:MAG: response regulator [Flavobacteriales bacterium]|nr:response regulator [Flavobacteriales bacterium]NCP83668.1 response regulator [Bacteroidota bacterium]